MTLDLFNDKNTKQTTINTSDSKAVSLGEKKGDHRRKMYGRGMDGRK